MPPSISPASATVASSTTRLNKGMPLPGAPEHAGLEHGDRVRGLAYY
jgi:hypothetical protein